MGTLSPQEWELTQCLFGEHLLKKYPDKDVCLVEAEKTAIICSGFMPQCVWVAVGGKTQLGDKVEVLAGRRIIIFLKSCIRKSRTTVTINLTGYLVIGLI